MYQPDDDDDDDNAGAKNHYVYYHQEWVTRCGVESWAVRMCGAAAAAVVVSRWVRYGTD